MLKKIVVFSLVLLAFSKFAAAGDLRFIDLEISNNTFQPLVMEVNQVSNCLDGFNLLAGQTIAPGQSIFGSLTTAVWPSCPTVSYQFSLKPKDGQQPILVASGLAGNPSDYPCQQVSYKKNMPDTYTPNIICTVDPKNPQAGTLNIAINYKVPPRFDLIVENISAKQLANLGYFPEMSTAYDPLPPSSIAAFVGKAIFSYLPLGADKSQNTQAEIKYGFGESQGYCLLNYNWDSNGSTIVADPVHADAEAGSKFFCQVISEKKISNLEYQATVKINTQEPETAKTQVTLMNKTGDNLELQDYRPIAGATDKYFPDKTPPLTVPAQGNASFNYVQNDGADGVITYRTPDKGVCTLTYNNINNSSCRANVNYSETNPLQKFICVADKVFTNGHCEINVSYRWDAYKARNININLNNFKTADGKYAQLKLDEVLPNKNKYSQQPQDIGSDKSTFIYAYQEGYTPGVSGSVKYRYTPDANKPNDYSICNITYNWQKDTGCKVDASTEKHGDPSKLLSCTRTAQPVIASQACTANINFSDQRNQPEFYQVAVYNTLSIPLTRQAFNPAQSDNYNPLPPATIGANGQVGSFQYNTHFQTSQLSNDVTYRYQWANDVYDCKFSYGWDNVNKLCVGKADKSNQQAACYVKEASFPPVNGQCNFIFSVGGQIFW